MIDLRTREAKEIAAYFSNEVNNLLFRPEEIAWDLKDSELMMDLDICWIRILSSKSYRTDGRNEASAVIAKQLADIPFIKRQLETVSNAKMEDVAGRMAMDHRTLQQTFSGLIFYHFLHSCNKREAQTLVEAMGDSFYRLPLI